MNVHFTNKGGFVIAFFTLSVYNRYECIFYTNRQKEVFPVIKFPLHSFTRRDIDILNILWDSDEPMTASQIVKANPDLTINTVQAVIRKLLKASLIEIADIVYSGTVLCRSYRPTLTENEFALKQFGNEYQELKDHIPMSTLMASLLGSESSPTITRQELDELQSVLDEYRKKLERERKDPS